MTEERVLIGARDRGAGLLLEGVIAVPDAPGKHPGVVVCHPHPRYGGNMDNNVVFALCRSLAEAQIATLRFNFRGVGASQGSYSGGAEEEFDVLAATAFLEAHLGIDAKRLGLAGYSFGAKVSMAVAAKDPRIKALAAVSPPTHDLSSNSRPWAFAGSKLFIIGDHDNITTVEEMTRYLAVLPEPKELHTVPGADHFWAGYESVLGQAVAEFFSQTFRFSGAAT